MGMIEAMKGGKEDERDIPSDTELSCVLLDLIKSRVLAVLEHSLFISVTSYALEGKFQRRVVGCCFTNRPRRKDRRERRGHSHQRDSIPISRPRVQSYH